MRRNKDSPANLILLSLPSGATNTEYLAAIKTHLQNDDQDEKNALLSEYFGVVGAGEAQKAAVETAFVRFVIETMH
jgi:hypothetical protein